MRRNAAAVRGYELPRVRGGLAEGSTTSRVSPYATRPTTGQRTVQRSTALCTSSKRGPSFVKNRPHTHTPHLEARLSVCIISTRDARGRSYQRASEVDWWDRTRAEYITITITTITSAR